MTSVVAVARQGSAGLLLDNTTNINVLLHNVKVLTIPFQESSQIGSKTIAPSQNSDLTSIRLDTTRKSVDDLERWRKINSCCFLPTIKNLGDEFPLRRKICTRSMLIPRVLTERWKRA